MRNKKIVIILICFVGLIAASYFAYDFLDARYKEKNIESKEEENNIEEKQDKVMAKDFVVYDENLNKVKLSSYIGTPIVLNFWASWCPPCIEEMKFFNEISNEYEDNKLMVLMINLTDGERETMDIAKKFIKDNNYNMNVLFDNDGNAGNNYALFSIPRTIFIDKNGYIVEDHLGLITKEDLNQQIDFLLNK